MRAEPSLALYALGHAPVKANIYRVIKSVSRDLKSLLQSGCYSLVIQLKQRKKLRIGKLGEIEFPPGIYVYTGSAMGGLRARLLRHLSNRTKLRWHIDYFLNDEQARIERIFLYPAAPGQECRQNQKIGALRGALSVRHKFGASDCKSGCRSHLIFFPPGYRPNIKGTELHRR
jgi:Uri superfamily endonuclease